MEAFQSKQTSWIEKLEKAFEWKHHENASRQAEFTWKKKVYLVLVGNLGSQQ